MKNKIVRNIAAVLLGIIIGSIVNMSIIKLGALFVAVPEGVNPEDIESIKLHFHLYEPKHFIVPLLAHGFGTLCGAFVATKVALSQKKIFAILIGILFSFGGMMMVYYLPNQPLWVIICDLGLAYLPMGWLGYKIAETNGD
ncbi:MAG: hypothetical protein ACPG6V_07985 [Flavobacteriales bacterium]